MVPQHAISNERERKYDAGTILLWSVVARPRSDGRRYVLEWVTALPQYLTTGPIPLCKFWSFLEALSYEMLSEQRGNSLAGVIQRPKRFFKSFFLSLLRPNLMYSKKTETKVDLSPNPYREAGNP